MRTTQEEAKHLHAHGPETREDVENARTSKAAWLALVALLGILGACGSQKEDDRKALEEEQRQQQTRQGADGYFQIPKTGIADGQAAQPADPCDAELEQKVFIRSDSNVMEAMFSGKVDAKSCTAEGRRPVLLIKSELPTFEPPPSLDCQPKPDGGDYNIRCLSPQAQIQADGVVSVTVRANASYQSSKVKMRLVYEK